MKTVTVEEAGAKLAELIENAQQGEDVVIERDSEPVARLIPAQRTAGRRKPGSAKDVILYMAPDFDAPLEDFTDYM